METTPLSETEFVPEERVMTDVVELVQKLMAVQNAQDPAPANFARYSISSK